MLRTVLFLSLSLVACKKDGHDTAAAAPATKPPAASTPATTAGPRRVAIEVNADGYVPDKIAGKPGEKLTLVFTRTIEADCIAKLKTPDGTLVDLPKDKAVDVAITVPQTGALTFACGMDMFHGTIVADTKS